jgi:hypothetical protein
MVHHRISKWQRICIPEWNVMGVRSLVWEQVLVTEKVPLMTLMPSHLRNVSILVGAYVKSFDTPMFQFALPISVKVTPKRHIRQTYDLGQK